MKARVTIVAVDTFRIAGESAPYAGQQYHGRLLNHIEIPGLLDCGESGNPVRSLSIDVRNIDNWIRPAVQNLWGATVIVDVDGINETWVGKVSGYNQSRTGVLSIDAVEDSLAIFKLPLPDETVHLINWPDAEGEAIDTAVNMPFGGTAAHPVRVKAILVDRVRFIYLISVGTIRQVVRVLKNREELADGYSATLGTEVQALYPGYAYVRFDTDPRDSSGNWPEVLVDVLGLVVGSSDETECRNPARILKHLLITPRTGACGWGLGVSQSMINESAFDQAISDCETAGLLLDGCFFAKREAAYWMNQIWTVGRIKLTLEAGKWTPRVEKTGVSEQTFTGNDLQPISWGKGASNERKNLITLYYSWDVTRDRLIRSVKRSDPTGHAGSQDRLGIQEEEVEAILVQDATTAQKVCDYLLRSQIYGEDVIEFETRRYSGLKRHSVITVNVPEIDIVNGLYRITEITPDGYKAYIKARSYSDEIYSNDPFVEPPADPALDSRSTPAAATDVSLTTTAWVQTDGTLVAGIFGAFTPGARALYSEVAYGVGENPDTWFKATLAADGGFRVYPLVPGQLYTVRITGFNVLGRGASVDATITTAVKDTPPAKVTGFAIVPDVQNKANLLFSWNRNSEPDLRGYKIRRGGTNWDDATPAISGNPETIVTENRVALAIAASGSYTWRIKAVDRSGNESAEDTIITLTYTVEPDDVSGLSASQDQADRSILHITWQPNTEKDLKRYEVRVGGTDWDNASLPVVGGDKIAEPFLDISLSAEGPLPVRVKALNRAGFLSASDAVYIANIILTPSDIVTFQALQNGATVLLSWSKVADKDCIGYEVREGPAFGLGALVAELDPSKSSVSIPVSAERDYKYWIAAVNRSGYKSENPISASVTVMELPPLNVVTGWDELALQTGTHDDTEFGTSQYTMATLGGQMSDYPTLRMNQVGSSQVLRLQAGKTWGQYTCVQKDMGEIITARIAVDWFVMALAAIGMAGILRFRSSLNGTLWTDWAVFAPVTMTFRYLEFEIELTSTDPAKTPEVTLCTITVDVPDKEINFTDHTILAAGTEIQYGHTFHEVPSVSPTALGSGKAAELVSKDETKCFIKIRDVSSGTYVAGTADIRVRGY